MQREKENGWSFFWRRLRDGKIHPGGVSSRAFAKLSCMPVQAVGLDGFHYHQDYILTHSVTFQDGRTLPMKQLKGSPETYDVVHFQEKLKALRHSDPLWPVYDRRFHDVIEDQLPVTAPIVLIEGNWLLFQEGLWRKLAGQADYTIFIKAEERALKERLLQRKMTEVQLGKKRRRFIKPGMASMCAELCKAAARQIFLCAWRPTEAFSFAEASEPDFFWN